jgi:regulator of protease activity HflC (stomatin/prohibitin superfamily)
MFGFHAIREYEQGIVFRWGKLQAKVRQPGLTWVNPFSCRLISVNMQTVVAPVPAQEAITRDNVTLTVDAIVHAAQSLLAIQPDHGLQPTETNSGILIPTP